MATIRKRGDRWQVQIRRAGLKAISRSFLSKRDAAVWARQMEAQADRRELPANGRSLRLITLGELVERYRDEVSVTKRGVVVERAILGRFLRHAICARSLAELSASDFADYRDERLHEIKPTSLRRQLVLIHSLFEVARDEWGIAVPINPIANLRLTVPNDQRDRRLRPGELERILDAASQIRTPYLSEVILFAIETGMRRGEILSIRWRDVDLDRRAVRVTETKNGHPRVIPLSKAAMSLLNALRGSEGQSDARVFPVTANALRLAWERLRKRSGIDDLRFHDLRHEAISRFFEKGLSVPEVSSISGHRDLRMLQRYAHARQQEILRKIDC